MLNIINFKYSFLIKDDALLMHHKIKRIIYKMTFDKMLKHMKYTNKIMRKLIDNTSK